MSVYYVKTQQELEAVMANPQGGAGELRVIRISSDPKSTAVKLTESSVNYAIELMDATVEVHVQSGCFSFAGNGTVRAYGHSHVQCKDTITVIATDDATVLALDDVKVTAFNRAKVEANWHSHVRAYDKSTVFAIQDAHIQAYGCATVFAGGSCHVVAHGRVRVEASGKVFVSATEFVRLRCGGRSQVLAQGAVDVVAYDQAIVRCAGNSVTVQASSTCTVVWDARIDPKVQSTCVTHPLRTSETVEQWCKANLCQVTQVLGGSDYVVLYKAVNKSFNSFWGANYAPGTETVAADWDGGVVECGKGLHFSATPLEAKTHFLSSSRYIACRVLIEDLSLPREGIFLYPNKIKAKRCFNLYECDLLGEPIQPQEPINEPKAC